MWDIRYRPIKKVVEARWTFGGANILIVTNRRTSTISMNSGVYIRHIDADDFVKAIAEGLEESRKAIEAQ